MFFIVKIYFVVVLLFLKNFISVSILLFIINICLKFSDMKSVTIIELHKSGMITSAITRVVRCAKISVYRTVRGVGNSIGNWK